MTRYRARFPRHDSQKKKAGEGPDQVKRRETGTRERKRSKEKAKPGDACFDPCRVGGYQGEAILTDRWSKAREGGEWNTERENGPLSRGAIECDTSRKVSALVLPKNAGGNSLKSQGKRERRLGGDLKTIC